MTATTLERTLNPTEPTKWSALKSEQITGFVIMINLDGDIVYKQWLIEDSGLTPHRWRHLLATAETQVTAGLSRVTSYRDRDQNWHNLLR